MSTPGNVGTATKEEVLMIDFVEKTGSSVYNYSLGRLYSAFKEKETNPRRLKMYLRDFFNAINALEWVWDWDADVLFSKLHEEAEELFGDLFVRLYQVYDQEMMCCSFESVEGMLNEIFDKLCKYKIFAISCHDFREKFPDEYWQITTNTNPRTQKPWRNPVTDETVTISYGFRIDDSIIMNPFWL